VRKLPLSVTRRALLAGRSDHAFRESLYKLFTLSERLEVVRRYLGERIGISGPQYNLLMAIAELQGSEGVSVGRVAEYLHVAGPFVTTEAGKLARLGYLRRVNDAADKRVCRLSVGSKGWVALKSLFPGLQQVNDTFFAGISRDEFAVLCKCLDKLVLNSEPVLARIGCLERSPKQVGWREGSIGGGAR
jgi:DNA-binding MarR family transcriptional regulator